MISQWNGKRKIIDSCFFSNLSFFFVRLGDSIDSCPFYCHKFITRHSNRLIVCDSKWGQERAPTENKTKQKERTEFIAVSFDPCIS